MSNVISIDESRSGAQKRARPTGRLANRATPTRAGGGAGAETKRLTKAGLGFRKRFIEALDALSTELRQQIASATKAEEVPDRITVSAVLKRAKASPLAAYSPLHRDELLPMVEKAATEIEELIAATFKPRRRTRATINSLRAELRQLRFDHSEALAKLASQRLSEFVSKA